jgi:hypothetical protein
MSRRTMEEAGHCNCDPVMWLHATWCPKFKESDSTPPPVPKAETTQKEVAYYAGNPSNPIAVYVDELSSDDPYMDTVRLDWLQSMMTPKDSYCEIYLAGLRNGDSDATAYQVESSPEKFNAVDGLSLRDAIDKAMEAEKCC